MLIFSLDLDAFYCAVEQKYDPSLNDDTPFIVYQKNCIATLSYAARRMGIKKLGSVSDAVKQFPQVRLINGESLVRYRHEGKELWKYIKNLLQVPVERLGLEELRFDLGDIVDFNVRQLEERGVLDFDREEVTDDDEGVWLYVSKDSEPFFCDEFFFELPAKVYPADHGKFLNDFRDYVEYYVAGHLAVYIQEKIKLDTQLSCSIGVARNITLAKMACSYNKPSGVTVLPPNAIQQYLDPLNIRKIPGFGHKTVQAILEDLVKRGVRPSHENEKKYQSDSNHDNAHNDPSPLTSNDLTVQVVRQNFTFDQFAKIILIQTQYLWDLLHGIDAADIKDTPLYPGQVSVEDSYLALPFQNARDELKKLCTSLLQQLCIDIIDSHTKSWLAYPTTFRLAIRHTGKEMMPYPARRSKSSPVYSYVYDLCARDEVRDMAEISKLADRVVNDNLYPMMEELWKPIEEKEVIKLINIAATTMVETEPATKRPPGVKKLDNFFRLKTVK